MSDSAWRLRHLRRTALALAAFVLALAAIGLPAATVQAAARPAAPPVPVLSWTDCGGGLQCTTAQVPLDYEQPNGQMISIALIRLPAGDPAHRIGSLLVNPGGPGGSGVQAVRNSGPYFPAELRARFDLVGFDPRGVGESTPVRCFASQAEQQAFWGSLLVFPVTPAEDLAYIRAAADFDQRCGQRSGELLPHVTTANTARDMDLLRQALGEAKLSYLGVSYGTYLGTTYANLFPDKVRALVLDGAVEPIEWATGRHGEGDRLPVFLRLKSDEGSSQTLGAFLDLCAGAGPSACPFAVGTDRQATHLRFQNLMTRLREHPVPVPAPQGTGQITYAITVEVALAGLYNQTIWPTLAYALQHLDQGDGTVMLQIIQALAPPSPTYDNTREAQLAVICGDTDSPRAPYAWPAIAAGADLRSPYFGAEWAWTSVQCAKWPARDTDRYAGPYDRPTANPILVVGNTFDPATRYQSAVALSHELANARLLTLDGWGHTAFNQPSTCAHNAEIRYLVDLQLPAPGTVCKPDVGPFGPVAAGLASPAPAIANLARPILPAPLAIP